MCGSELTVYSLTLAKKNPLGNLSNHDDILALSEAGRSIVEWIDLMDVACDGWDSSAGVGRPRSSQRDTLIDGSGRCPTC